MPEIDGVNVVPSDPVMIERAKLEQMTQNSEAWQRQARIAQRKLNRVRDVAKELKTVAPHAAILIEGALER